MNSIDTKPKLVYQKMSSNYGVTYRKWKEKFDWKF